MCRQTLQLARLLGEDRSREFDIEKFKTGTVVVKIMEECRFGDGTQCKYAEERIYHPPGAEYFKGLAF